MMGRNDLAKIFGVQNPSNYYKAALRRVYRLALDGNWKCDRAIRRVCEDVLGGSECASIIAERRLEKTGIGYDRPLSQRSVPGGV